MPTMVDLEDFEKLWMRFLVAWKQVHKVARNTPRWPPFP